MPKVTLKVSTTIQAIRTRCYGRHCGDIMVDGGRGGKMYNCDLVVAKVCFESLKRKGLSVGCDADALVEEKKHEA